MFLLSQRLSLFLAFTLLFAAPFSGFAQGQADSHDRAAELQTAWTRASHLRHGINISQGFLQTPPYTQARLQNYIGVQDFALIKSMGFDHVRICIDPSELELAFNGGAEAWFLRDLDSAVDAAIKNDLAVLIDVHPPDSYKTSLQTSDAAAAHLAALWQKLAAHYATRNPNLVFFEILNEPTVNNFARWEHIQAQVDAAIRTVAPSNTLIATGPEWAGIPDLIHLKPLGDGNVIYTFHFYEPHAITHEGATWGKPWWRYTHAITYPPNAADMARDMQEVPQGADGNELKSYWLDHWDGQHIRSLIDKAAAWSGQFQVPAICDEFGVFSDHIDPTSRANWIHDVRTALEADGIGWTMFEFRGGFGLMLRPKGQPQRPDPVILQALGMNGK